MKDSITISIATLADRENALKETVKSLIDQCDKLNIYLHYYKEIPSFLVHSKIEVVMDKDHGDMGDADKFFWCETVEGYHFTCDDDLIYPKDYVAIMVSALDKYERKCVVTVHGHILSQFPLTDYFGNGGRRCYACLGDVAQDELCFYSGTGVLAYHTDTIKVSKDAFPVPNMADIWFGLLCKKYKIPTVVIKHKADWIKHSETVILEQTIAGKTLNDNRLQCEVINWFDRWEGIEFEEFTKINGRGSSSAPVFVKFGFDSAKYWIDRYNSGGNSGSGSYGKLAEFKAEIVNNFIKENNIVSVIEFGCGDGNQLRLAEYPSYVGYDISQKCIDVCKVIFNGDESKHFCLSNLYQNETAEVTLSLDVIYHLCEDDIFNSYMERLFGASERFVIIYSSNFEQEEKYHQRPRMFSNCVNDSWRLIKHIPNRFPFNSQTKEGSLSEFYIYEKVK